MLNLKKFVLVFLILFIAVNVATLFMMQTDDMSHGHCPFAMGGSLCPMSITDHLNSWQSSFLAITDDIFAFLLVLAVSLITFVLFKVLNIDNSFTKQFFDLGQIAYISLFKELKLALASGIINPKSF